MSFFLFLECIFIIHVPGDYLIQLGLIVMHRSTTIFRLMTPLVHVCTIHKFLTINSFNLIKNPNWSFFLHNEVIINDGRFYIWWEIGLTFFTGDALASRVYDAVTLNWSHFEGEESDYTAVLPICRKNIPYGHESLCTLTFWILVY